MMKKEVRTEKERKGEDRKTEKGGRQDKGVEENQKKRPVTS